jgi:hypothetical protein
MTSKNDNYKKFERLKLLFAAGLHIPPPRNRAERRMYHAFLKYLDKIHRKSGKQRRDEEHEDGTL